MNTITGPKYPQQTCDFILKTEAISLTCGDTCGDRDVCEPADDAHGTSKIVYDHYLLTRLLDQIIQKNIQLKFKNRSDVPHLW